MNRFFLPLLIVFAAVLQAGTFYPGKPGEAVVPNEYLVMMLPGASASQIVSGIVPGANIQPLPALNIHKVKLPPGSSDADARRLAAHPFVVFVEPNRIRKAVLANPNDTKFTDPQQYGLTNTQAVQAWGIMPNGYLTSSTAGSSRVTVAVIDTGVDCAHPDFINAGGTSTDSALGGQLSFSLGKAYATTTVPQAKCAWADDFGHGTHVAGIVAAATNNNTGIASLGYPLQVAGYKGLDSAGSGDDATLSTAIMDAANAGIRIVSASWGSAGYSQTLQNAIDYAWQRNTLFIAAAGNDHLNELFYPAGATHAVGVAATDGSNAPANFSNFGDAVSIAAPGVAILSTMPTYANPMSQTNYGVLSGTSMATPFVSALAGLLAMATPNASAAAILQRIQQTAVSTNTNGGWDPTKGYGVINAYNALSGTVRTATFGALRGQVTDGSGAPVGSATITVSGQSPVTADANGLYRVASIPAGTYTVNITGGTFAAQNLSTTIAPGADTVLPVMLGVSYGRFSGTVRDAGVAVPGAIVQAITQSVNGPLISATAVTDQTGAYTLWVPAGTYDVKASTLSANSGTVAAQPAGNPNPTTVNVTIARFGVISGTVRSGTQGLNGAQLKIAGGGMSFGAVSDANGNYHTIGLPTGTYTIDAAYGNNADVIVNNVGVTPDTTTTANVQFNISSLAAPVLVSPSDGASGVDINTALTWNAVTGSAGYSVYFGTANPPPFAAQTASTSYTPGALNVGTTYYWTVASRDPNNGNAETKATVRSFTTVPPASLAVFGTGVSTAGVLAADGAVDSHYTLIASADAGAPGPNTYVAASNAFPIGPWIADGPNSKWIAPVPNASTNVAGGNFTYRTTFNLTGVNLASVVVNGAWAADNSGVIQLNGVAVPNSSSGGFNSLTPFTITSGFVSGVNTLDFVVNNTGGPSGLRVDLSATGGQSGGGPALTGVGTTPAAPVAGQQFSFTLTGTGFDPNTAQVLFNGPGCTPCTVANSVLTAKTTTSLTGPATLNTAGTYTVSMQNGSGTPSNGLSLMVGTPAPSISSLSPSPSNPVAGQQFTLTINGSNFNPSTVQILITGTSCSPCTVPNSVLTTKTASQIAGPVTLNNAGSFSVSVQNGSSGTASNTLPLTIGSSGTGSLAVFGTGVASAGVLAADGTVDSHYTLIASADAGAPGPNTYVAASNAFPIGPWIGDGPNSKWIAPLPSASTNVAGGNYTYRTTFNLTGFNLASVVVSGAWAADNSGIIKLNGATVPNTASGGFNSLTPFTISSGFINGVNTLDFVVTNADGPSGLRVDLSATGGQTGGGPALSGVGTTPAAPVAGQQFSFTLTGTGFDPNTAQVLFNGPGCTPCTVPNNVLTSKTTTSLSGPATLNTAGTYTVSVQNASGSPSNGLSLTVGTPAPSISSLSPSPSNPVAGQQFTLTINGSNLDPSTVQILITGTSCSPCTVPNSVLTTKTASQIVGPVTLNNAGSFSVSVQNGSSGTASNSLTLTVGSSGTGSLAVFGTGVASAGVLAADGSVDTHYTLIVSADASAPGPNTYVAASNAFPIGPWIADGPNSKWIAPVPNASTAVAAGNYTYRTTFNLTGFNLASVVLSGAWGADNSGVIKLNGVTVPNSASGGFYNLTPFTISSGFINGVNTLDFVVTNADGPSGLRVDLSGTGH